MAPRWPLVNIGPEHINEHALYLKEACNDLQAVDRGRSNQVPWNIVQTYIACTAAFVGKVLQQPSLSEVLSHIQHAAKDIQNIQRDVTVVKGSVGLSTHPPNAANFSGAKATSATWAQVAARGTGSLLPPPPVQQGAHASKAAAPTVISYKDRSIVVKLKDHGIAQRYRTHPAAWIRQQVQTAIHSYITTKSVKVIAAHQLKSGDIELITSTTTETAQLKEHQEWLKGLGQHAEVIVPTYGVIVHGVSTSSINTKDQSATIQQILADNHTVIPDAKIAYVGWLTREATHKRSSSIVVEFTDPEMANAIIYAGMAWEGQIHQCQLYDRACRIKQCFRCYHYGHIGIQCNASQICGYCNEPHETKQCQQKSTEGFAPRCTVCKGAHTAWSNACPARKKEMGRVEQAKQTRSIYWHVPVGVKAIEARTETRNVLNTSQEHVRAIEGVSTQSNQDRVRRLEREEAAENTCVPTEQHALAPSRQENQAMISQSLTQDETIQQAATLATILHPTPVEGETMSTTQREPPEQQLNFPSDSQLLRTDGASPAQPASDTLQGNIEDQNEDAWLNDIFNDENYHEWVPDVMPTDLSPPTSISTGPQTAPSQIYRSCSCSAHQQLYDVWPRRDAELRIAKCMTVCMYCGVDYHKTPTLRQHLKSARHAQDNITVVVESQGRGSVATPSWTHRPRVEPAQEGQVTRRQASTYRANRLSRQ